MGQCHTARECQSHQQKQVSHVCFSSQALFEYYLSNIHKIIALQCDVLLLKSKKQKTAHESIYTSSAQRRKCLICVLKVKLGVRRQEMKGAFQGDFYTHMHIRVYYIYMYIKFGSLLNSWTVESTFNKHWLPFSFISLWLEYRLCQDSR